MTRSLDIILPCYNPPPSWEENILHSILKLKSLLPSVSITLILVNDGSEEIKTASLEYLKNKWPDFRLVNYSGNRGKGYALRQGAKISENEICIYTDIDFPYLEENIISVYKAIATDTADIAVGVRSEDYYNNVPKQRRFLSKIFRNFAGNLMKLKVMDTQCGLKGFNRNGKEIFLKTSINRYLFDLEFIYLASRASSIRFTAIPVTLKERIVFRKMNSKILMSEAVNFLKILWLYYKK